MPGKTIEWALLKGTIILFFLCFMISILLVVISYSFWQGRQKDFGHHQDAFRMVSSRYLAIDEEKKLFAQYYPQFEQAINIGKIGAEHRLNWIEVLRQADEQLQLISLNYKIDKREEVESGFITDMGPFSLYSSDMELNIGLLHEEDLVDLFAYLDRYAEGHYSVSQCELKRFGENIQADINRPNILSTCTLRWFTFSLPGERRSAL